MINKKNIYDYVWSLTSNESELTYRLRINQLLVDSSKIDSGKSLFFLEHKDNKLTIEVPQNIIYEWKDNDVSEYSLDINERIKRLYTLQDGSRLIQTAPSWKTYLLTNDFKLKKEINTGDKQWHGSWSIDQSKNGTIMYSEYTGTKIKEPTPLFVWCSHDNGINWFKSLILNSSPKNEISDIRHYHTCLADPDIPGQWYVSTGDILGNIRLYVSYDDGINWERILVKSIIPDRLMWKEFTNSVLRFTSCYFDGNFIYWATDDNSNNLKCPLLVRTNRYQIQKGMFEILGLFNNNLVRNVIQLENKKGAIAITEAKHDINNIELSFIDRNKYIYPLKPLKNFSKEITGGTYTLSSRSFYRNKAYSLIDAKVLGENWHGVLEYEITGTSVDNCIRLSSIEKTITNKKKQKSLIAFFHSQRTAGTTIKKIMKQEFGENKVYYQRTVNSFKRWCDLNDEELDDFRVFASHDNFTLNPKIQRDCFLMSIVREPVDRAISLYYYLKGRPEHMLYNLAVEKNITDFYKEAPYISPNYVINVQTLRVCGKKDFQKAKETIEKYFSLVAPFERIDEAIEYIRFYFGLSSNFKLEKSEPKINYAYDSLDKDTIDIIKSINNEDILLYEYVKKWFSVNQF